MEYCPRSLYDDLRENPIPPERVLNYGRQITAGMLYLHGIHIIHRDLKVRVKLKLRERERERERESERERE